MATPADRRLLRILTYLMFAMFAMTTDSVGVIIPHVIERYSLGMTAGGAFQYATMGGIALAALGLGFMADRLGRKATIVVGLVLFGASSALFAVGEEFLFFVGLLGHRRLQVRGAGPHRRHLRLDPGALRHHEHG